MSGSLFFVKPAQNTVLLCSPQMSKLGEKVRSLRAWPCEQQDVVLCLPL